MWIDLHLELKGNLSEARIDRIIDWINSQIAGKDEIVGVSQWWDDTSPDDVLMVESFRASRRPRSSV